jgi:glycerol 2-dehydrogenase (NADP+)
MLVMILSYQLWLLGTWQSKPGAVEIAVAHALKHGYKLIDTAAAYDNEAEVGQGIKDSGVSREQFFLTTKLNNNDHGDPEGALNRSLEKLETTYLDLCMRPKNLSPDITGLLTCCDLIQGWCIGPHQWMKIALKQTNQ